MRSMVVSGCSPDRASHGARPDSVSPDEDQYSLTARAVKSVVPEFRFDRLVLRGSLRLFVYAKGLLKYLCQRGIKLKDFGRHSREHQRQSSAVSRKLALLRAHGLIRKVPHTHRYVLTEFGRLATTALLAARNANVLDLTKMAA